MLFKKKNPEEKIARTRRKLRKMNEEISEIWNGISSDDIQSDVNGWYTGNPQGFEVPEQDADDL